MKMNALPSFTDTHFVSNLYDFLFSVEHWKCLSLPNNGSGWGTRGGQTNTLYDLWIIFKSYNSFANSSHYKGKYCFPLWKKYTLTYF